MSETELRPYLQAALDSAAPGILKQIRAAVARTASQNVSGPASLPCGGFTLHSNETVTGLDNEPTMYVICSCGRGYAFGHKATSAELFAFLMDHEWDRPGAPD